MNKPHLLFLEDEANQIHMIEAYYKRCPLATITTAEFHQSAVDTIKRVSEGGVDYVILDMLLGNVDGYTVISNICRQSCNPKIWAYTALEKGYDIRNRFISQYILKKSGIPKLFAMLEAEILKNEPIICNLHASF